MKFFLLVLVVEAITNLISKSEIFLPLRSFLFKKSKFFHDLVDCPYCLSVWVGFGVSFCFNFLITNNFFVNWFLTGIILHRSSNVLHDILDKVYGKGLYKEV